MFKFLHAADIHLDSPLRGLERYEGAPADEIRGATRQAFENLVELALEENVAFVLLAGDLYDGDWKDYNTGLFFVERMARLRQAGIRVFVIAGNHDAASQITKVLRPPNNVKLFSTRKPETVVLEQLGVALHGQGFASRAVSEDLTAAYPQGDPQLFNIGLLHTCLDGKPGHEPYAPCSIDGLRTKGYQYWALGHVHQREEVSREPWIIFPGNIQGRHIRETGPKGATLVTVQEGGVTAVEHRDLDVLRWSLCRVDVAGCATVDEAYERVRAGFENALATSDGRPLALRLVLEGACQAHAELHAHNEHWVQECRALGTNLGSERLWLEKVLFKTRREVSLQEALERDDALGGLLRAIRELEVDDGPLKKLADDLSELKRKLPLELLNDEGGFDLIGPAMRSETLEDVKELLLARLLAAGGEQ